MYEFWYDYVKPKYDENSKLCCMDTDSFIVYVKKEDIYEDIAENIRQNIAQGKKIIELMKDES